MAECLHSGKTPISVEVDSGLMMVIDSHCNDCHNRIQERDKSQAAFVPGLKHNWSMTFDKEHLGNEADLMQAALSFIAQLKERKTA